MWRHTAPSPPPLLTRRGDGSSSQVMCCVIYSDVHSNTTDRSLLHHYHCYFTKIHDNTKYYYIGQYDTMGVQRALYLSSVSQTGRSLSSTASTIRIASTSLHIRHQPRHRLWHHPASQPLPTTTTSTTSLQCRWYFRYLITSGWPIRTDRYQPYHNTGQVVTDISWIGGQDTRIKTQDTRLVKM